MLQPLKAFLLISDRLEGRTALDRLVQLANAFSPILYIPSSIIKVLTTDLSKLVKTIGATSLTSYDISSSMKLLGMVRVFVSLPV